jgi:hypothetical protein
MNLALFHHLTPILDVLKLYNKFREMGIKTPKYFKTISMIGEDNQEHHGILVERIHSSVFVKPGRLPIPKGRTTAKTGSITYSCPSLPNNICKSPIPKFGCRSNFCNKF